MRFAALVNSSFEAMAEHRMLLAFYRLIVVVGVLTCFSLVRADFFGFDPFRDCPEGFANFGDSLTDTGNALTAFPLVLDPERSPYGQQFFQAPAKRFSNGRLVTDFFSQAFRKDLLDPYFGVTTFEYQNGINFAEAGATATPTATQQSPFPLVPFQVNQYLRFIKSLAYTQSQPTCANFFVSLPVLQNYKKWLFTIEIGGNDFIQAFQNNVPPATIQNTIIPSIVAAVDTTVRTTYSTGARQFLIFGLPAIGCSTIFATTAPPTLPRDAMGCVIAGNQLAQVYNAQLLAAVTTLSTNFPDASIGFFDYYGANMAILTNPTAYGFSPALILTACCGAPGVGTLNYNPAITCGNPGSNNCANPNQYVNWDGIHFTEAFYRQISLFALNRQFTIGGVNYAQRCFLDFSKFGPTATFAQVYPLACDTIFT